MISQEDFDDLKEAVDKFTESFETIEWMCHNFNKTDRRLFMNPNTFGVISAFLQKGAGYEPAYPGYEFNNLDSFLNIASSYIEENDDEN